MPEIRELTKKQIRNVLILSSKAYPMMELFSDKKIEELEQRILRDFDLETRKWYGLFEDKTLLGSMLIYEFTVNYYGKEIKASGVGFVAVDFLHKKQKISKQLLHFYLTYSMSKKYPLAMLHAFRPDFYKKMGFGYGTSCFSYVTHPIRLPKADKHYQMEYLNFSDKEEVVYFFDEIYRNNHGMIPRNPKDIEMLLEAPGLTTVGYRENGRLLALLYFGLRADESTNETTKMKLEILFVNSTGLKASLNFLNSQSDQVSEIAFSTPFKNFYYNLADIRALDGRILREPGFHHTYDAGMGIMYRSLDPIKLLLKRPCTLDKLKIRFLITDSFVEETAKDFIIEWKEGKASKSKGKKYDLEMRLDISDFSSWIMNSIDLTTLHQYGLVEISDEAYLSVLNQAFYYQQGPICLQRF
ncbi:MAG: GNAT family N-acetyltransferase [Candidatus Cloacimonetes bacterium]|nr:GNAT family N-acetyltransferase [Candidatus Cloacimonadota bacterium]